MLSRDADPYADAIVMIHPTNQRAELDRFRARAENKQYLARVPFG